MGAPDRKELGDRLQAIRKRAGFSTAEEFAAHIGIKPATYTGYEQGKGMFSYERAWELADALQCSMDELGGREWPPAQHALDANEQQLVGCYRRIDDADKPALLATASTMAYAGDAKKEAAPLPAHLAPNPITNE